MLIIKKIVFRQFLTAKQAVKFPTGNLHLYCNFTKDCTNKADNLTITCMMNHFSNLMIRLYYKFRIELFNPILITIKRLLILILGQLCSWIYTFLSGIIFDLKNLNSAISYSYQEIRFKILSATGNMCKASLWGSFLIRSKVQEIYCWSGVLWCHLSEDSFNSWKAFSTWTSTLS